MQAPSVANQKASVAACSGAQFQTALRACNSVLLSSDKRFRALQDSMPRYDRLSTRTTHSCQLDNKGLLTSKYR